MLSQMRWGEKPGPWVPTLHTQLDAVGIEVRTNSLGWFVGVRLMISQEFLSILPCGKEFSSRSLCPISRQHHVLLKTRYRLPGSGPFPTTHTQVCVPHADVPYMPHAHVINAAFANWVQYSTSQASTKEASHIQLGTIGGRGPLASLSS